ncbi:MAG: protein phosphatase CheZ [Kordiimonadaceae bacterium]|nr:protein phosphatase CheZ [Kordiimonadaceae bacterium]MBO6569747.1 protein phosphatase CheZ [Kordiimonadaceae bacterium]MBO6966282.1 protein phosphatase CheZ [Kordiimonadaceae bacterium]
MVDSGLPKQIELLVDNLRKQNTAAMSLTEVASVTEVLIGTMNAFYRSIDTSIYRECRALSDYITNARKEIASLQPVDLESARIPRAGLELDAIVQQTEEATNTIMEAAEEIMGADPENHEAYQATTQDAVMRIFEACSFQDITGQRISKVVQTLSHIEQRVLELRNLMGVTEEDVQAAMEDAEPTGDAALLSGPALKGEGIDQTAVDSLMDGGPVAAAQDPAPAPAPAPAPEPAAAAPAPAPAPAPPPAPKPPKAVNPAELDAMFDEDFDPVADLKAKKEAEAEKKEEKKADDAEVNLPAGEEVSQDDIDALFG